MLIYQLLLRVEGLFSRKIKTDSEKIVVSTLANYYSFYYNFYFISIKCVPNDRYFYGKNVI